MTSSSRPQPAPGRSRRTTAVLAVLTLAVGVLLILMFRWSSAANAPSASQAPAPGGGLASPESLGAALQRPAAPAPQPAGTATTREAFAGPARPPVHCTQSPTGAPLAGIWLYRDLEPLVGPSDATGELAIAEVDFAAPGAWTLWAKGWAAVIVRPSALPTEVTFERTLGALEVRLLGANAEHRMLRSLLKQRKPSPSPEGPWAPRLVSRELDVWGASELAPGSYNLYLWITFPDGEPRPFSKNAFAVEAGSVTHLTFDLAAPRDAEDQEDDS